MALRCLPRAEVIFPIPKTPASICVGRNSAELLLHNREKEACFKTNMTLSQAKAANTYPMTGVMPRTGSYFERDIWMRTKIQRTRKKEKN